jgi:hypothetical protein
MLGAVRNRTTTGTGQLARGPIDPDPEPALRPGVCAHDGNTPDARIVSLCATMTSPPSPRRAGPAAPPTTSRLARAAAGLAAVATLLSLALFAAACGDEGDGNGNDAPPAPVGSVEVIWDFALQDGGPSTCSGVGAAEIFVFVGGRRSDAARAQAPDGGTPPPVTCDDAQSEVWTQLVEDTLPVVIQVYGTTGQILAEHVTTVRVVPQMRTTVEHTFAIGGTGPSRGDLRLTWNIDGLPAADACGPAGAVTVAFATQPGSIEALEFSAPCENGAVDLEDLRVGNYILRARLLDAQDEVLAIDQQSPTVRPDAQASAGYRFNLESLGRARLHATWTIEGLPPDIACDAEGLSEVEVRFQRLNLEDLEWIVAETATAACSAGSVTFDDLIDSGRPRLELLLLEEVLGAPVIVTTTVTEPFDLPAGETSTVSVDFVLDF